MLSRIGERKKKILPCTSFVAHGKHPLYGFGTQLFAVCRRFDTRQTVGPYKAHPLRHNTRTHAPSLSDTHDHTDAPAPPHPPRRHADTPPAAPCPPPPRTATPGPAAPRPRPARRAHIRPGRPRPGLTGDATTDEVTTGGDGGDGRRARQHHLQGLHHLTQQALAHRRRQGPLRRHAAISTISHISFAEEESVSPKKPTSIAEVAKQRELRGTLLSEDDSKMKRQISDLKSKELSGTALFFFSKD